MVGISKARCEYRVNPMGIEQRAPRISWQLVSDSRCTMQKSYRIQVSKEDASFGNLVWDTGAVESDRSIHVEYAGESLESGKRYFYRVKVSDNKGNSSEWSETAYWEMGLLNKSDWKARWITSQNVSNACDLVECPFLRKEFILKGKVKSARIYATSLGIYELYINGSIAADTVFAPGWTSYHKRIQYQTYDVTDKLNEGVNAIGAAIGNGWYKGNIALNGKYCLYGDKLALLLQLAVKYENGEEDIIISDESWKTSTGPILTSEIYHGETYDAHLEMDGWSEAGFDDGKWMRVSLLEYKDGELVAQENVPVRAVETISPLSVITTPKGETVLDFGQNLVGRVAFSVEGAAGTEVILKHAETLDAEGNFYTYNLRGAKSTNKYILKGSGRETYEPHFTFQGFRYVMVDNYPGEVRPENFVVKVMHSDLENTGNFKCSNELVNRLQSNIQRGQRGNLFDLPTDCPQRDERLGWTGDTQTFLRTSCFNMNVAPVFTKWLKDLYADQSRDKGVRFFIPHVYSDMIENYYSSAVWGDAATICPWTIYTCYGDERILEVQYESMKQWVDYIERQGDDRYLWNTGFHFGDWFAQDSRMNHYTGPVPVDFIATAFYAYSTSILAKSAGILGKTGDEAKYSELHENILKSFRREFVTPGGRLAAPSQTGYVLALMFDLVEEKHRKRTVDMLVKSIEENDGHLTTGFCGAAYICHVLSHNGRNDIAYKLLLQDTRPSWLYMVTKGATTIWERWDGIREDGSFAGWDNSFNHPALGAIGDWMYRVVAGIDAGTAGYKHILIRPMPDETFSYAEAEHECMYGKIKSSWKRTGDGYEIEIEVPANTTAEAVLPSAKQDMVYESGVKLSGRAEIKAAQQTDEGLKLELGSGKYAFKYAI